MRVNEESTIQDEVREAELRRGVRDERAEENRCWPGTKPEGQVKKVYQAE